MPSLAAKYLKQVSWNCRKALSVQSYHGGKLRLKKKRQGNADSISLIFYLDIEYAINYSRWKFLISWYEVSSWATSCAIESPIELIPRCVATSLDTAASGFPEITISMTSECNWRAE